MKRYLRVRRKWNFSRGKHNVSLKSSDSVRAKTSLSLCLLANLRVAPPRRPRYEKPSNQSLHLEKVREVRAWHLCIFQCLLMTRYWRRDVQRRKISDVGSTFEWHLCLRQLAIWKSARIQKGEDRRLSQEWDLISSIKISICMLKYFRLLTKLYVFSFIFNIFLPGVINIKRIFNISIYSMRE